MTDYTIGSDGRAAYFTDDAEHAAEAAEAGFDVSEGIPNKFDATIRAFEDLDREYRRLHEQFLADLQAIHDAFAEAVKP